ncbi:MAG: MarR family transcriptional regulator [Chthonomonadaceae bacterium]|nr:MarR family transcriptional regulator [Chthonomonadaceae bacterium]
MPDPVTVLMDAYPKIFFACHTRHVRDPKTGETISAKQASILDHLDEEEPLSLNHLASHMGVTSATMCVAVDKLVSLGYVKRERSTVDRRQVVLLLTRRGKEVADSHSVLDSGRVQAMLSTLDSTELRAGLEGITLLANAAERYMATRGPAWKDTESE